MMFDISQMNLLTKTTKQIRSTFKLMVVSTNFFMASNNSQRDSISAQVLLAVSDSTTHSQTAHSSSLNSNIRLPQTIKLSEEAQKAIWASKIIQIIKNSTPPTNIKISLRDQIIQINKKSLGIDESYDLVLEERFRNEVLNAFILGDHIDERINRQERVTQALNRHSRLVYFPTNSVTKSVFNYFCDRYNHLLIGSFGIGKTISVLLFMNLSAKVNKLNYLALASWIPQEKRAKYKEQLQLLTKLKLITDAPKCFYWSISPTLNEQEDEIKQLIMLQTEELCLTDDLKDELYKSKSLFEIISKINDLHPNHMKDYMIRIVAIDQINRVTSYFRDWNTKVMKYASSEHFKQQMENDKALYLNDGLRLRSMLAQFKKLGLYSILSSSFHIEEPLIGKVSKSYQFGLQFYDKIQIKPNKISYAQMLKLHPTKIQFCQLFLFLLEQCCKQNGTLKQNLDNLKDYFSNNEIKVKNYYRFLFVREYFRTSFEAQFSTQLKTVNLLETNKQLAIKIEKNFDDFSLQFSRKRLNNFIEKGQDEALKIFKRVMIRALIINAFICIGQKKQKLQANSIELEAICKQYTKTSQFKNQMEIKSKSVELKDDAQQIEQTKQLKINDFFNSNKHNTELLPWSYDNVTKIVSFDWTPAEFIQIAYQTIYNKIEFLSSSRMPELFRSLIKSQQRFAGDAGEGLIKWVLMESKAVKFRTIEKQKFGVKQVEYLLHDNHEKFWSFNPSYRMNKDKKQNKSKEKNKVKDKVNKSTEPKKIERKQLKDINLDLNSQAEEDSYSLNSNMKQILQMAKNNRNLNVLGIPHFQSIQKSISSNKQDPNSKSIDFMFVKYTSEKNEFEITTFDATISSKQIKAKVSAAVQLFTNLLQQIGGKDECKYKIHHVILCPSYSCKPRQAITNQLSISYYSITDIQFNCQNKDLVEKLQQFIAIVPCLHR